MMPEENPITQKDLEDLIDSVSPANRPPHDPTKPAAMTFRNGIFYEIYIIDGKIVERKSEQQY